MARAAAELPSGTRITDYVNLGVITKVFPVRTIDPVLKNTGKTIRRQRDLPAHVVVYYVIALALYMQSSYREVLRRLFRPCGKKTPSRYPPESNLQRKSAETSMITRSSTKITCSLPPVMSPVKEYRQHFLWLSRRHCSRVLPIMESAK